MGDPLDEKALQEKLRGLLDNEAVFGVSLFKAGLADAVCRDFARLTAGPGAVRETLHAL